MGGKEATFEPRCLWVDQSVDSLACREAAMAMLAFDPLGTPTEANLLRLSQH